MIQFMLSTPRSINPESANFLDDCHTVKLMHNMLAGKKVLQDKNGQEIK